MRRNLLPDVLYCAALVKFFSKAAANAGRLLPVTVTILFFLIASCREKPKLFSRLDSGLTGIHFNNRVLENDSINPIDLEFLYNGGGVGTADFNKDGLPDLYFTSSTVGNKLYLNKGNLQFEDVTDIANVGGAGRWTNGVAIVDINNDGLPDMYLSTSIRHNAKDRTNLLYVNQGVSKNGVPVFREMAAEYGLDDSSYSVQAAFFDYDHDGDLDMFLVTTRPVQRDAVQFSNGVRVDSTSFDKLFRNDWNDRLGHPVFTDVSATAGIREPGYGLGVAISDLNGDGWSDIYVSNDFLSSDECYINNHDGTFTNRIRESFKHNSQNAMGTAVADINNDGLPDIMTVDMDPAGNLRRKTNLSGANYAFQQNMIMGNYMLQYVRNTLQLNLGTRPVQKDSISVPVFADISFLAGVAATDWSWSPCIEDFDNDGWRDIIVTNGYPKDVTDHDFAAYRHQTAGLVPKKELLSMIPVVKIPNAAFRNKGTLKFDDATADWGLNEPSFSNGAVAVDLDNDGDLDFVVNNINDEAFLYRNNGPTLPDTAKHHFLNIRFQGSARNPDGIGARAEIYYRGRIQTGENNPSRGYLSCTLPNLHFGLDSIRELDSVIVSWPRGERQVLRKVGADQSLTVKLADALSDTVPRLPDGEMPTPFFSDVTAASGIDYLARETDHIDFDNENLLPHKLSQYGPGLAVGDVDKNGLDDIVIGISAGEREQSLFLQQPGGVFRESKLPVITGPDVRRPEIAGMLLFDADGDGDPDLYEASGSNEFRADTRNYQDRLLINDGAGHFRFDSAALPVNFSSKSCVRAIDFDQDGDLDLFIGARSVPGSYPTPASSILLRNDSKPGQVRFTDVTAENAPMLQKIGLVCDALATDFDGDGITDLILTGEWMPVIFLKNDHGKFRDVTATTGLKDLTGWWNSIAAGDFDNDGDIDYVVGNLGENSFYHASPAEPLSEYAGDFDHNDRLDAILTAWIPDEQSHRREFPVASRDEILRQIPALRKKYLTYRQYGATTWQQMVSDQKFSPGLTLHTTELRSGWIENTGSGQFRFHPLPTAAQLAPIYGITVDDFDGDGNIDIAINGNDYGTDVVNGRYDALNGLVMLGNGKGGFSPLSFRKSGLYIPGDGKALVSLAGGGGQYFLAASQNRGRLKLFSLSRKGRWLDIGKDGLFAIITLKDGRRRKQEFYLGSSFYSQSTGKLFLDDNVKNVLITDRSGKVEIVTKSSR